MNEISAPLPAETHEETDDLQEAVVEPQDAGNGPLAAVRKEAAGYRRRLRETEAERDRFAGQLRQVQRAEIERLARTAAEGFRPLVDGADLWHDESISHESLIADDGTVDVAAVREAVETVAARHPHWRSFLWGSIDAGRGSVPSESVNDRFADVLQSAGGM